MSFIETIIKNLGENFSQVIIGIAIFWATLKGPSLGIQAQKNREKEKEANNRRLYVFRTLMETRADRLSQKHIDTLNIIDIEFYNVTGVVHAWKEYFNHLNIQRRDEQLLIKRDDLFIDMLYEMSKFLNYDFTKPDIRNNAYIPEDYYNQDFIRREQDSHLANILAGRSSLPIVIRSEEDKN